MFSYRVASAVIAAACVLAASALGAGVALAQYEPVGKPLQLVPQVYSSRPAATPRSRVSARKAARSETGSESRSERSASQGETAVESKTQQHASFRRKHRPRTEVAEQRRLQRPAVAAANAETTAPTAAPVATSRRAQVPPATASAPAAAPVATPPPTAAQPPQSNPAAAAPKNELVVGGQTVQVRSPNEANELDLAANEPSATASAPANDPALSRGDAPLYNLAATVPPTENDAAPAASAAPPAIAAPAVEAAPADAPKPKSAIGSPFWFLQIMAALGGAAAAGSAAWFLIGSASPRIRVTQGPDDEA